MQWSFFQVQVFFLCALLIEFLDSIPQNERRFATAPGSSTVPPKQ